MEEIKEADGGKPSSRQVVPENKVAAGKKVIADKEEEDFKSDSTNLSNSIETFKGYSKKYPDSKPEEMMGDVGEKWYAAKDSIRTIANRRSGDPKFLNRMKGNK
jgi:hypothetical protein